MSSRGTAHARGSESPALHRRSISRRERDLSRAGHGLDRTSFRPLAWVVRLVCPRQRPPTLPGHRARDFATASDSITSGHPELLHMHPVHLRSQAELRLATTFGTAARACRTDGLNLSTARVESSLLEASVRRSMLRSIGARRSCPIRPPAARDSGRWTMLDACPRPRQAPPARAYRSLLRHTRIATGPRKSNLNILTAGEFKRLFPSTAAVEVRSVPPAGMSANLVARKMARTACCNETGVSTSARCLR
jgi:hypothetical protein